MLDIFAAIIPSRPSWEEMIYFSMMGFGIVLFVLAVLSALSSFVGVFFKKYDAAKSAPKAAPQAAAAPKAPAAVSPEVSKDHEFVISAAVAAVLPEIRDEGRELLAVLTAAATVALEEECSIVSFKEARPDMSYAYEGRMQIFASKIITPARVKF